MIENTMNIKYIRIAELVENIDKVNKIIALHQKTTKSVSMIRQYNCQRDEFIKELQQLFLQLNLSVQKMEAA